MDALTFDLTSATSMLQSFGLLDQMTASYPERPARFLASELRGRIGGAR